METYPGLRIGNYLYFALQAHKRRSQRHHFKVMNSGLDPTWFTAFPAVEYAMATPAQVRWWARISIPASFFQEFGVDFSRAELESFVTSALRTPVLDFHLTRPVADLVVNVRRGDYTISPFKELYTFNITDYLRLAVRDACDAVGPDSIQVVSDDLAWCRSELMWLDAAAPRVFFGAATPGPVGDFMTMARGSALVLANSTFSYWAAYVSQCIHGEKHGGVWAPDFHQANVRGGRPWQHDPRWKTVPVSGTSPRD